MKKEVKDTVTFSAIRENKFRDLKDAARIERVKIAREQWDSFLRMSGLDAKITLEEFGYIVSIVIGDTHISGRYGDTYIGFNHNIFGRAQKHRLQLAYNKPRSVEELVNFFTKIVNEEKENEERRKRGSDQSRLSVVKWSKVIQILSSSPEYVGAMNALVDNYGEGIIEKSIVTKELASSNQLSFILDYKIPGPNFDITDKLTVNIRMSISHADQTFGKPIVAIIGGIRGVNASDPDELIRNASTFSQAVEHVRLLIQHVVEAVNVVMERDYYKPSAQ